MPHAAEPDPDRYADALIAMGEASGALVAIEDDLRELSEFMRKQGALRQFLASPLVQPEGKTSALREVLGRRVHPVLLHYVQMLQSMQHLAHLPAVTERFFAKITGTRQQVSGEIVTAVPLLPDTFAAITAEVCRVLGKDVHLQPRLAPGIVGGVFVKVGDFIIDGTVETLLDTARRQLVG
jgi:F-type H+-transporting ATPase subunit delta